MVSTASAPRRRTRQSSCNEDHDGSWRGCTVCRCSIRRMDEGRNSVIGKDRVLPNLTNSGEFRRLKAKSGLGILVPMTVTVKNKSPLVVPNRVRREAGFKNGDRVEFRVSRGMVTILPKPHEVDDTLTATEAKKMRHALTQVRE